MRILQKGSTYNKWLLSLTSLLLSVALIEGGARFVIFFLRGSSTIGMPERKQYLNYEPFVMYGPQWDTRLQPEVPESEQEIDRSFRILLLGGSVAASFPVDVLEKAFLREFPNRKFRVINASLGGYNARQELVVASIWGPRIKPNIIITLDGANDLNFRLKEKRAGTFYLNETYDVMLRKPYLGPFTYVAAQSQFIQGILRLVARIRVGSVQSYSDAIPVYVSAQHSINVLARGVPAKRIMVLQPYKAFKHPLSAAEVHFKSYAYREPLIVELYKRLDSELKVLSAQDGVKYVDGRCLYDGLPQTIFGDDVHFVSNEGYKILAERIAQSISEEDLGK